MSEQGRSQAAWTQGSLGAGIMLYLRLIEPMGTPRTLNRAQASSNILMSLTMGQRERNWKTKRPWILMYLFWWVTSLLSRGCRVSGGSSVSFASCLIPSTQDRAWWDLRKHLFRNILNYLRTFSADSNIEIKINPSDLRFLGGSFLSRWGVLFQACAGMSLRSVPGTKGKLMASSAREFLNSLWPNNTGKPSKYAYITSVNTIQPSSKPELFLSLSFFPFF